MRPQQFIPEQAQPMEQYAEPNQVQQMSYAPEMGMANVLDQINPQQIIDNLDHSLKGEIFNKETGAWEMNPSKKPLVNNSCRGAIISYITGLLTNNTTMAIVDKNQLSGVMESVIETLTRTFVVNLEEYGFVEPGPGFEKEAYENKGVPDTARMTMVANMVYAVVFLVLTRALNGMESKKIFSSLSMSDTMGYGMQQQSGGAGWLGKLFGRQ